MRTLRVVLFWLVCLLASKNVCAQPIGGYTYFDSTLSMETSPAQPSPTDIISLTLSGQWSDSCVPSETRTRIDGKNIFVDLLDESSEWICATVITDWTSVQTIGPLDKGDYEVYLTIYQDSWDSGKTSSPHFVGTVYVDKTQLLPTQSELTITRCEIAVGKESDSLSFSGLMNAKETDLTDANSIIVSIDANDMPRPLKFTFPVNGKAFKNGKYNYARMDNASRQFFKLDTKNGKIQFSAKHVDLTGLSCPISVAITIGDYTVSQQLNESLVNGDNPCPIKLMRGIKKSLTVDKYKIKHGKKPGTDSFTAKGTFTLDGIYDKSNPLVITLGIQTFTVPGKHFADKKVGIQSCRKAVSAEGPIVDAKFDFVKCTYSISVKNTVIDESSILDFGINCFGVYMVNSNWRNSNTHIESSTVKECLRESESIKKTVLVDSPRFSLTVRGRQIEFEDTIEANCCKEDIQLGLSVTPGQILVEENVVLQGMCLCICDFPVEATLGPLAPGEYLFKVIQYANKGSAQVIGQIPVTIE